MGEWLRSLMPWGTEAIVWAQSLSSGWLDAVFEFFTRLGYEEFYLLLLPFVYWCVHKEIGIALGYLSLSSSWANSVAKMLWKIPRPSDPRVSVPLPETSPSFPSGHAQGAVANWGYLAYRLRSRAFWVVAVLVIVGISLSRIVLGVHFPQDIIGGLIIGLILTVLYAWATPPISRWLGRQTPAVQLFLAIIVPLALLFLHPADVDGSYPAGVSVATMSALVGLGIGVIMERAWVRFRVAGEWWRKVLRLLAGLVLVGVFYVGPRLVIPSDLPYLMEAALRFVRYALVGWAVSFLGPFLFVRVGLAKREPAALKASSGVTD